MKNARREQQPHSTRFKSRGGHTLRKSIARFQRLARQAARSILPGWFAVNMGTGIASILLFELPYQVRGQQAIANAIFAYNAVLFAIFLSLTIARYVLWPRLVKEVLLDPVQPLFIGTFPQGFATLITMSSKGLLPATSAGSTSHSALLGIIETFWWLNAATSTIIAIGAPYLQIRHHQIPSLKELGPFLFLCIAATVISAATGSTIADDLPPSRAWNVVLASYTVLGTGLPICLGFMSLHTLRLLITGLPPRTAIISTFLPLGPCGQAGLALVQLGRLVNKLGREEDAPIALFVQSGSILMTLLLWGLGLFWLVSATASVLYTWQNAGLQFNLGYWGCTFPIGAFATSTLALASPAALDSQAFRIIGTVLGLTVVALWLTMTAFTVRALISTGNIYGQSNPPPLPSIRDEFVRGTVAEAATLEGDNAQRNEMLQNVHMI
ncbi:unnamed protein product [Sympodiomycopsis kandeliae]